MSNKIKQEKIALMQYVQPKLRFPEFQNLGYWASDNLGSLYRFITTNSLSRDRLNYKMGSVKNIHYGDIHKKFSALFDAEKEMVPFINDSENISKFKEDSFCTKGDIIFADASEDMDDVGKSIEIVNLNNEKLLAGLHTLFARQRVKKLIVGFGGYLFQSDIIRDQIKKQAQGTKVFGISAGRLATIEICYPLEKEQQKIADCLSSIDEVITEESKKFDALKTYKKGLMQQLFPAEGETLPKLRFPEFEDSGSWEKIRIIDLASKEVKWSFTGGPFGSNLKSSDYTNTGIRVIQLQNIGDGEFIDNYKIYTSETKANELLSCNIYPGEIILSKMGDPVARACLIPDKEKRYVMCSDGIRLAVDKNKFDNYFIYSFINSEIFRVIAGKSSTGSTRKRIGLDILKNLKIMIPTIQEQKKIANILYLLDNYITNQSKKMYALKNHKKGLMQQLFPTMSEL